MRPFLEVGLGNAVAATALAVIAAAVGRVCRRPAVVHVLWLFVLLKLITPPLAFVPLPGLTWREPPAQVADVAWSPLDRDDGDAVGQAGAPALEAAGLVLAPPGWDGPADALPGAVDAIQPTDQSTSGVVAAPFPWVETVAALWVAGVLLWSARVGWNLVRFRRLLRQARPAPAAIQDQADTLAHRLGLARAPTVWLVAGAVSPMVWFLGRAPRLLFPAQLLDRLDRRQRATLLVHELAHVRRRDHWVRLIELAASGLYWWHPVVWWARKELHEAEELCCDGWVVDVLDGAGRAYALALLETVAFFSKVRPALPAGGSGTGQVPQLRRRLTMIMQGTTSRSLSRAGTVAVLGLGLMLLPFLPTWAQDAPAADPFSEVELVESGQDAPDPEIQSLKRLIRVLEERGRANRPERPSQATPVEPGSADGSRDGKEDLTQANQEVAKAAKQLAEARRQAADAEKALARAKARVTKIQSSMRREESGRKAIEVQEFKELKDLKGMDAGKTAAEVARRVQEALNRNNRERGGATGSSREAELDKKLDKLLQEVEELRREIRRPGQPGGPGSRGPRTPDRSGRPGAALPPPAPEPEAFNVSPVPPVADRGEATPPAIEAPSTPLPPSAVPGVGGAPPAPLPPSAVPGVAPAAPPGGVAPPLPPTPTAPAAPPSPPRAPTPGSASVPA